MNKKFYYTKSNKNQIAKIKSQFPLNNCRFTKFKTSKRANPQSFSNLFEQEFYSYFNYILPYIYKTSET